MQQADLILHVRDIADPASASQRADVNGWCSPISVSTPKPSPTACSKCGTRPTCSIPSQESRRPNEAARHGAILVSAVSRFGLDLLLTEIEGRLNRRRQTLEIAVQPQEGALSNWIYENCEVISRADLGEGVTSLRIRVAPEKRDRLARVARRRPAQ